MTKYGNLEMPYWPHDYDSLDSNIGFSATLDLYEAVDGEIFLYSIGIIADLAENNNEPYIDAGTLECFKDDGVGYKPVEYKGIDIEDSDKAFKEFVKDHSEEFKKIMDDLYEYYSDDFKDWQEQKAKEIVEEAIEM